MSRAEQLINVLKQKQPRRIMVYMEVQIAGQWVWELYPVSQELDQTITTSGPAPLEAPPTLTPVPLPKPSSSGQGRPIVAGKRSSPMTQGRDPAKHFITMKPFKGLTIEQADAEHGRDELFGFSEWARKQEEPSSQLEVCAEMIEAYLIDREYVPTPKYKTSRRA